MIEKESESLPPVMDQLTFSSALKVKISLNFSTTAIAFEASPEIPEGPVMIGAKLSKSESDSSTISVDVSFSPHISVKA